MTTCSQLKLLLHKNCLLKKKSKCGICCDIVFPVIVVGLLLALISLLSILEFDYDTYDIMTLDHFVNNRSKVLYGPSPLSPSSQKILDFVKMNMVNTSGGSLSFGEVDHYFIPFGTEAELDTFYANNSDSAPFGIWFNENGNPISSTNPVSYSLRYDQDRLPPNGGGLTETFATSKPFGDKGFCSLQLALDQAIINEIGGTVNQTFSVNHRLFPNPHDQSYQKSRLGRDLIHKTSGAIFITAGLMIYAYRLVTELVVEKETKIKEGMTMMGMSSMAYYLSWNISSLYIGIPITVVLWLILKVSNIIHSGNWGLVLLLFLFYFLTLLLLGNIFSLFFDKSKFAGILTFCYIIALSVAGYFIAESGKISKSGKIAFSLISPFAFQNAIYTMAEKDLDGIDPDADYYPQLSDMVGMLFLDIIIYVLLLWYLDKVVPSEYGVKENFYFFLTPSYWRKAKKYDEESNYNGGDDHDDVELIPFDIRGKASVSVRGLRKEFNTGNGLLTAVDDLSLEIYPGIHVIIGHNGSGKSTSIGMLTGLVKPTKGDAFIQGNSISGQMSRVRQVIGVCPQQDIIWRELTVFEHLSIYASLKGVPSKSITKEAEQMAREVGLQEKMHTPAGVLSGGQKRKLCLGIAFIGRSQVIFLDEVTSGMDPLSRRSVWDFLLTKKQGRTIVLTTHFMDEADFLGDRIAIISHGKLRCDGSPLYLKKRFGVGYLLTLSKNDGCQSQTIVNFIQRHIPEAVVLSDAGTELSLRLPTASVNQFVPLFNDLDNQKATLGFEHYGISITTMEEVFLRLGQEGEGNGRQFDLLSNANGGAADHIKAINTNAESPSARQQLRGLLVKRIRTSIKDARGFFLSILLPAAVIFASIVIYKKVSASGSSSTLTPLNLNMSIYPANQDYFIPLSITDNTTLSSSFLATTPYLSQLVPVNYDLEGYLKDHFTDDPGAINFTSPFTPSTSTSNLSYTVLYNINYKQPLPVLINMVSDSLLRSSPNANGAGINIIYKPFKHVLTWFEKQREQVETQNIIFFTLLFSAGYALMGASFAGNVCQERAHNIKRLLYISGCKKHVYWLSNLIWDYSFATILFVVVTIVMVLVDTRFRDQWGIVFLSQLMYCIAIIPLSYLFSYKFRTHGKATGAIFGIFYTLSVVFFITTMNIRVQAASNQDTDLQDKGDIVDYVFYALSPLYCLANIMIILAKFPGTARVGELEVKDFWSLHACGLPLIYLAVHMVIWVTWLFVLDLMPQIKGKLRNPKNVASPQPPPDEDSDVANERIRVRNLVGRGGNGSQDAVVIHGLSKTFPARGKNPTKIAVYNTTLGLDRGTTFGLIGMNGSGKTTTLSMLSGDIYPTSGSATINGFDLITERGEALRSIGSCPQFDALIPLLSAREQLTLYCRIKGIPESKVKETVEAFISMMDVGAIANSNVGGYSGGNKRKISLSIAMLGNPSVVFLDEASTGCDPQVRRFMWNVISELGKNKVIIITTHSMEECEALCQRITIMKDGKFTCLGSIQHIKSKFGSGYSIDIKFKKEYLDSGVDVVLRAFPGLTLLDRHDLIANFELPNPPHRPVQLCSIFQILQTQLQYLMDDYSVSITSLDTVFLKMTAATHATRMQTLSQYQHDPNADTEVPQQQQQYAYVAATDYNMYTSPQTQPQQPPPPPAAYYPPQPGYHMYQQPPPPPPPQLQHPVNPNFTIDNN